MNKNHTAVTTILALIGSIITAYTPQIQKAALAFATTHPSITFVVVGAVTALVGALPSSIGAHPDGPRGS